jgi:hypothetical protein
MPDWMRRIYIPSSNEATENTIDELSTKMNTLQSKLDLQTKFPGMKLDHENDGNVSPPPHFNNSPID